MIDIKKQIEYWQKGAEEDFALGSRLVGEGHIRHGLFLVHLALEKIIKAHVCRHTNDIAPQWHNLVRLLDKAGLVVQQADLLFLGDINQYNIEGRYPEMYGNLPSTEEASKIQSECERIFTWLRNQL